MKPNRLTLFVILSIFMFPSFAYANPMSPVIGLPGIFIALAMESVLLTLLVKSYGIRPWRFMIIWYLITFGTFVIMTLFIYGVSWLKIPIDLWITILEAELLVVLAEAIILRWLLKQAFILKHEAKKMSFAKALFLSFIVNVVSFISGFIMLFLSSSSG